MPKRNPLFRIEHSASLDYEGDDPKAWSEDLEIKVSLYSAALSSGWLREHFSHRGGPMDLLVLQAIGLHARPLNADDIQRLRRQGVTLPDHARGRLVALVTDEGLEAELGFRRQTIAESTTRLAAQGMLDVWHAPRGGAQNGKFGATKIYALSSQTQKFFIKTISPKDEAVSATNTELGASEVLPADRVRLPHTENLPKATESTENRVRLPHTVALESPATVCGQAQKSAVDRTQIGGGLGGGGGSAAAGLEQKILDAYAHRLKRPTPYRALATEQRAVENLLAVYPQHDWATWQALIERHAPDTKHFTLCARRILANTELLPELSPDLLPEAARQPELPDTTPDTNPPKFSIPLELAEAAEVYAVTDYAQTHPLSPAVLVKLRDLATLAQPTAQAAQVTTGHCVAEAFRENLQADNPLAYARRVITRWNTQGFHSDARPANKPASAPTKPTPNGAGKPSGASPAKPKITHEERLEQFRLRQQQKGL